MRWRTLIGNPRDIVVIMKSGARKAFRMALAFPLLALLALLLFPVTIHDDAQDRHDLFCGSVVFPNPRHLGGDYIGTRCTLSRLGTGGLVIAVGGVGMLVSLIVAGVRMVRPERVWEDPNPDVPPARGWSTGDVPDGSVGAYGPIRRGGYRPGEDGGGGRGDREGTLATGSRNAHLWWVASLGAVLLLHGSAPVPVPRVGRIPPGCGWVLGRLPNLAGAASGRVRGTDGSSRYAGSSGREAVLWVNRQLIDLGQGVALDVNRAGVAVGVEDDEMEGTAMMWKDGQKTSLAVPPSTRYSAAAGINDSGQIVGHAVISLGWPEDLNGPVQQVGLAWSASSPHQFRTITSSAGTLLRLTGVTETGMIVGQAVREPTLWTRAVTGSPQTGMTALDTLSPTSEATAVAAEGDYIVGSESGHGVEWRSGRPQPLSGDNSEPAAVNQFGEVTGTEATRPAVWVNGVRTDLPIPATMSGEATAITNHREIGGSLVNNGPSPGTSAPVTWTCHTHSD